MKDSLLYYTVGALLYCPANSKTICDAITEEQFGTKYSLALCLEDTIRDDYVHDAEQKLAASLQKLLIQKQDKNFYLPKIFIRVRRPEQMESIYAKLGTSREIATGFIAPKFDLDNADSYLQAIDRINSQAAQMVYLMPILESFPIINLQHRAEFLYRLKEKLDAMEKYVLNIRVGGNDLCHMFGFRRHITESIHDIRPISNIFSDIITVFGMNYIISGPVWEYYGGTGWETGLRNEIRQDMWIGFTGKTVIHPKQIDVVNSAYRVSRSDYEDAKAILNWNPSCPTLVSSNPGGVRMNEYKTHTNWAKHILYLAEYFGIW